MAPKAATKEPQHDSALIRLYRSLHTRALCQPYAINADVAVVDLSRNNNAAAAAQGLFANTVEQHHSEGSYDIITPNFVRAYPSPLPCHRYILLPL